MVRVSQGTASVAGLKQVRLAAAPTTASIMIGEHCSQNCSFCAQSRSSQAKDGFLSRVPWPEFPVQEVIEALTQAYEEGKLKRVCLQVVANNQAVEQAKDFLKQMRLRSAVPLSISCKVTSLDDIQELIDIGVERIGLALDAASSDIYKEIKGGNLELRVKFLIEAAEKFSGHIATHLIAGLGETEEEIIKLIQLCYSKGIRVGLFAFTPIKGTLLEHRQPPHLNSYRRIQAARFLIEQDYRLADKFSFDHGRLINTGMSLEQLGELLGSGRAFQTSGCPNCNRPFYNERPGTVLYNYPRPLTRQEIEQAIASLDL